MVDRLIQTTDGLPAHQRWDSWRETIRLPTDAAPLAGAGTFEATRSIARVGAATLIDTVSEPLSFRRSARQIAQSGVDQVAVLLWMRGGLAFESGSRPGIELGAGDLTVCDLGRPYGAATLGFYRELRVMVPRETFAARIGRPETLSGMRVPRADGLGALAAGYIAGLFAALPTLTDKAAALGLDGALHLLSNLADAGRAADAPTADETILFLAECRIKAHMADATLDAHDIARALGLSRSRLYAAFKGRGGVATVIRDARLARAGDLLRSEAHRGRSMEEVARLCGFADYSSFSRGFRRHFGASPRDWRGHRQGG